MPDRSRNFSGPSTSELIDSMAREISASYPVGALLPSEALLQERFGATRYRLREAMRALRNMGIVDSRAGIGTLVLSKNPAPFFAQSQQTIEGILEAARTTRLRRVASQAIVADADTAALLREPEGTAWCLLDTLRYLGEYAAPSAAPIGALRLYLRPEFSDLPARLDQWPGPVFKLVERLYGVRVAAVEQEIDSANLDRAMAKRLQAPAASAALKVTRHWYDAAGKLVQCSVGLYPQGRSRYRSRLLLDDLERKQPHRGR